MAIIGFLVGLIIAVLIGQRIVQRYIFLLHKRQLAQEFTVKNLAEDGVGVIPMAPVDRGEDTDLAPEHHLLLDTSPSVSSISYGGIVIAPPASNAMQASIQQELQALLG